MCDNVILNTVAAAAPCAAAPIAGCQPAPNRAPQVFKEVAKVPGAPGQVHEVVRRLPTPTADLYDKTIIEQPGQDVVNVVYERPSTPPPNVVERRLVEAPPPAQVNCFERRVPHRPRAASIVSAAAPCGPCGTVVAAPIAHAVAAPIAHAVAAPCAAPFGAVQYATSACGTVIRRGSYLGL